MSSVKQKTLSDDKSQVIFHAVEDNQFLIKPILKFMPKIIYF